ncbi:MAG: M48 family metalloprotease, partial [Parasphingorhabdus sp.]
MRNILAVSLPRIGFPAIGRFSRLLVAFLLMVSITVQPVAAQSILRDAETEALFIDMVSPLVEVSELDANEVEVILINDRQINAFVAGGQRMFFYSGLIEKAESANEVQG